MPRPKVIWEIRDENFRRIGTATGQFGPNTVQSVTAPSPIGGTLTLTLNLRPPAR